MVVPQVAIPERLQHPLRMDVVMLTDVLVWKLAEGVIFNIKMFNYEDDVDQTILRSLV